MKFKAQFTVEVGIETSEPITLNEIREAMITHLIGHPEWDEFEIPFTITSISEFVGSEKEPVITVVG
jgi:hypothetical protein